MLNTTVQLPLPALIALVLLALPTIALIAVAVNDWGRSHTLRLIGHIDDFRDDGTYVSRWCLFYVPIRWESGCHSTGLLD